MRDRARQIAAVRPELHLVDFTEDGATLVEHAARVIGMAGYNSVCEIVSYRKPALLVPRDTPRLEQTIRARRFSELGLVEMLSSHGLTPEALSQWIARAPAFPGSAPIGFTALEQVPNLVTDLLQPTVSTTLPHLRAPKAAAVDLHVH